MKGAPGCGEQLALAGGLGGLSGAPWGFGGHDRRAWEFHCRHSMARGGARPSDTPCVQPVPLFPCSSCGRPSQASWGQEQVFPQQFPGSSIC